MESTSHLQRMAEELKCPICVCIDKSMKSDSTCPVCKIPYRRRVDEAVKERIFRSDVALQSSSSNNNSKAFSGSRCPDLCTFYHGDNFNTPRSLKPAIDRKASDCTQRLRLADNDSVSIISCEDDDNLSTMSSNDLADAEGSSGEQILEQEITSHEIEEIEGSHSVKVQQSKNSLSWPLREEECVWEMAKSIFWEPNPSKDSSSAFCFCPVVNQLQQQHLATVEPFKGCYLRHEIRNSSPNGGVIEWQLRGCFGAGFKGRLKLF